MSEVVKKFYETEELLSPLIKKYGDLNEPVDVALLKILDLIDLRTFADEETYQKIDLAVKNGHPDQEMYLLFFIYLITMSTRDSILLSNKESIIENSHSVYRISRNLDVKKARVETQAFYYLSCSNYFYTNKNFVKGDELGLHAITLMPKECARYFDFFGKVGQIFSYLGRLLLISNYEQELKSKPLKNYFYSYRSLLMNALFTMDKELITKYQLELTLNFKGEALKDADKRNCAIKVINGNLEKTIIIYPEMNNCLAYYKALKIGDTEAAKKLFGSIPKKYFYSVCYYMFYFAEYHHSFVTGWYENIEQIIKNKEEKGYHYMLDLFVARYFRIKGNQDLARFYYAQLIKNCEKFKAIGRLKFELQFAFELEVGSFFDFTYPRQVFNSAELRKSLEIAMTSTTVELFGLNRIIGNSSAVKEVKKKIKLFADIQRPILLIGETGSGKEILAQAIHEESKHKNKPFLAINCGALTDTLLQSELFGYEAGAFTGAVGAHKGIFEAAEDGIVFLDEFGEMSPKLQVSLLRIFENNELIRVGGTKAKEIKCRIIAATNANIEELIQKKLFREDLYYRLKQFSVIIPPLRDRKEDIPELINYFLNQTNTNQKQNFSKEVMLKFQEHPWPGNIRELKNEIDRIKILCGNKPIIELSDIDLEWIHKNLTSKEQLLVPTPPITNTSIEAYQLKLAAKKISSGEKRKQQLIQLFQQHKQLTRIQIAETLEVSLLTVTRDLRILCDAGTIVKRMPTLSPQSHFFEINEIKNELKT